MYLCFTVDFPGTFCIVVMGSCRTNLFAISQSWKPVRLQCICYKHIEIYAYSRTLLRSIEQQSTGYLLTGHRRNCKYSELLLLFNTAVNGFQ